MRPLPWARIAPHFLNEVDRARDIGVDHAPDLVELLVEEALAQAPPRIGKECLDPPPARGGIKLLDAFDRGEVGLNSLDSRAKGTKTARGLVDFSFIGSDDKVEATSGTLLGEFVADATGGASDDRKRTVVRSHGWISP
jgi:hypothetical protein